MKGWKPIAVKELIAAGILEIGDGYRAKNSELDTTGLPFARAGNINNGFLFDDADLLSLKSVLKAREKVSCVNDCVITTKGTFGRVGYVRFNTRQFVYSPQLCYWRSKENQKLNPRFLFYWLQGPDFLTQAHTIKSSTDMADYANLTDQRAMDIHLPPLTIQRNIAAVLSAYDDLIENNNRRIAILEKMAEELYREWFVRLRFPGHEKVKIVKGVPEGWEVIELNKLAKETSKSTKPGTHLEGRYYLPMDLLQQRHFNPESHQDYEEAQSSLVTFQKNDIIFGAMRPYLHKVCIAPFDGITRTTCFVIRPSNDVYYSYLYLLLFQNSTIEYASLICNGADRPYVIWNKAFERMFVFKPSEEIVRLFEKLVRPLLSKISGSYFYLQALKSARDRLLIRLMSGKIDVEDLDIQFPASMKEEKGVARV